MNFFKSLNRKEKRKFNRLSNQEKTDVFAAALNEKLKERQNAIVAETFVDGYLYASKMLESEFLNDSDDLSLYEKANRFDLLKSKINSNSQRYDELKQEKINKEKEG